VLMFEWNALRIGDEVSVHCSRTTASELVRGVVAMVDWQHGANGVGIRVTAGTGGNTTLWPARLAVHREPRDPAERCQRCQSAP